MSYHTESFITNQVEYTPAGSAVNINRDTMTGNKDTLDKQT